MGVLGMREGGERRILVPSTLGYGETGNRELNVPPGTNLVIGRFAGFIIHLFLTFTYLCRVQTDGDCIRGFMAC